MVRAEIIGEFNGYVDGMVVKAAEHFNHQDPDREQHTPMQVISGDRGEVEDRGLPEGGFVLVNGVPTWETPSALRAYERAELEPSHEPAALAETLPA